MSEAKIKWDQTVFNRTLQEYTKVSRRSLPQILNTKGFFIARKALWHTPKADSYRIKAQLGQFVSVNAIGKKGKIVKRRSLVLAKSRLKNRAPLAAVIINKRLGKEGKKGLHGKRMARAVREMLANRLRGVAFLKSGWLEAIRKLGPLADKSGIGKAPLDRSAKQIGRAKGDARPARESFNPTAVIVNLATTARDRKGALVKYGTRPLQVAFDDEAKSMNDYIERKLKPATQKFNQQQK